MQKFDLHMHTTYCDGSCSAEDMIKASIDRGLDAVGLSGHSFTPHDQSYCMSREGTEAYIAEINGLKEKYADKIRVLLGLELDYYADTDTAPYDYLIGSVHYLFANEGSVWSPVDEGPEYIQDFAKTLGTGLMDIAELYYETEADVVNKTGCDVIGHFDLITKFSERYTAYDGGVLVDTRDERYIRAWKHAADRIFDDCAKRYKEGYINRLEKAGLIEAGNKPVFEINYGAISKGYRSSPYPSAEQISYIRSKGGLLINSSDAHRADHIAPWL